MYGDAAPSDGVRARTRARAPACMCVCLRPALALPVPPCRSSHHPPGSHCLLPPHTSSRARTLRRPASRQSYRPATMRSIVHGPTSIPRFNDPRCCLCWLRSTCRSPSRGRLRCRRRVSSYCTVLRCRPLRSPSSPLVPSLCPPRRRGSLADKCCSHVSRDLLGELVTPEMASITSTAGAITTVLSVTRAPPPPAPLAAPPTAPCKPRRPPFGAFVYSTRLQ